MIQLLLTATLWAASLAAAATPALARIQTPPEPPPGPDPAVVEAALEALASGMRSADPSERVNSIRAAADVPSPQIATAIAKRVSDTSKDVQSTVLEALRYFEHPQSLEELHRIHRRARKRLTASELLPALYRSIGQHASTTSLPLLGRDLFGSRDHPSTQARILAIGRIRDARSVELLIAGMRKASGERVELHMPDLRLALMVLTGVDRGSVPRGWTDWWRKAGGAAEVSARRPNLPRAEFTAWTRYWGLDEPYERERKREDRGRRK